MSLYANDVRELMLSKPRSHEWVISDITNALMTKVEIREAIKYYRSKSGFTEDTDPNKIPLDRKIRQGRRYCVKNKIQYLVRHKEVARIVRKGVPKSGGCALIKVTSTCKIKITTAAVQASTRRMCQAGVGHRAIKEFLLAQTEPITLKDVIEHFRPDCNQEYLRKWGIMVMKDKRLKMNRDVITKDQFLKRGEESYFSRLVRDVCRATKCVYTPPPMTDAVITPPKKRGR